MFDEACAHAYKLADEHGYTFVHPFNDLEVATGQGTIAMEIIKELPTVDYILVPIGGGGLCTGVSTLAKLLNPEDQGHRRGAGRSRLHAGVSESRPCGDAAVASTPSPTARRSRRPASNLFPYIQENVDDIITVED